MEGNQGVERGTKETEPKDLKVRVSMLLPLQALGITQVNKHRPQIREGGVPQELALGHQRVYQKQPGLAVDASPTGLLYSGSSKTTFSGWLATASKEDPGQDKKPGRRG